VISDPTGLLARFKSIFDNGLFQDPVIDLKLASLRGEIQYILDEAKAFLQAGKPNAAMVILTRQMYLS
jgi:hypothetical protein